jgi:1,2-diacylglycerol 3-beta-glucosyltransferase
LTVIEIIKIIAALAGCTVGAYVVFTTIYSLFLLSVAAVARLSPGPRHLPELPNTKFCLVIPAHDEELVISHTLDCVAKLDYPAALLQVVVIADNCTDGTVGIASRFPDVKLLERFNDVQKGKGYALNWALDQLCKDQSVDTFAVVDADTVVDSMFLRHMDAARVRRSKANFVAQGRYGVANRDESWRTALMSGALSLVHVVRPLARERLKLSVGLKGNGMCFDRSILQLISWRGNSLTEDIDFALDLLEQQKIRVEFVDKAIVSALMPTSAESATTQRQRWERGRSKVSKLRLFKLLILGLVTLNSLYVDAALDLLLPPLAQLATGILFWISCIGVLAVCRGSWHDSAFLAAVTICGFAIYVVGGFVVGGAPKSAFKALAFAPFYILWKILIRSAKPDRANGEWVRTARQQTETTSTSEVETDRAVKLNH